MTPTERPVGMTVEMVRAILDGSKTETRRPVKRQPGPNVVRWDFIKDGSVWHTREEGHRLLSGRHTPPLGVVGDLVYVRERARVKTVDDRLRELIVRYEADGCRDAIPWPERIKRPTVGHCLANGVFKEGARLWLRIDSVDVERVQSITEEAAQREGFAPTPVHGEWVIKERADGGHWSARKPFAETWQAIYASRPGLAFDDDPWVWAHRFSLVSTTGRAGVSS